MSGCMLCPRRCGANREKINKAELYKAEQFCGELNRNERDKNALNTGFCGETEEVRLARAALHFWEEPCISGEKGSGAVFFSGCNLRCVFCQNYDIARSKVGKEVTIERLAEIFIELKDKGANNINLVTGTHFVPQIVKALDIAKDNGLNLPIVYNSGGYESLETLRLLDGYVDIYLPDFKYMDPRLAAKYSNATDYVEVVKLAIEEMFRQVGSCKFDEDGMIKSGVIVRHLVLPGHTNDSRDIVSYLYDKYGDDIYMSIMSQYTPLKTLDKEKFPELNRSITDFEYGRVVSHMLSLGVDNAFIQEKGVDKESFIPAFDYEGV